MKKFNDYVIPSIKEEPTLTTGPGIAGTSDGDTADWMHGKKKKPLTRRFIEIMGKRKKLVK